MRPAATFTVCSTVHRIDTSLRELDSRHGDAPWYAELHLARLLQGPCEDQGIAPDDIAWVEVAIDTARSGLPMVHGLPAIGEFITFDGARIPVRQQDGGGVRYCDPAYRA